MTPAKTPKSTRDVKTGLDLRNVISCQLPFIKTSVWATLAAYGQRLFTV